MQKIVEKNKKGAIQGNITIPTIKTYKSRSPHSKNKPKSPTTSAPYAPKPKPCNSKPQPNWSKPNSKLNA